jgi:hypothetical protein
MFQTFCKTSLAILVCLMAGLVHAQVDSTNAEAFLRKSGLWRQLGSVHLQVKAGFREALVQRGDKSSEAETLRMMKIIDAAYEGERLRKVAVRSLSKSADAQHSSAIFAWYDSALGLAITSLEELASAEVRAPSLVEAEGAKAFEESSPARKELLAQLIRVTRSPEAIAMMSINTTLAILQGVAQASPNTPMPALPSLRYELEKQKPNLQRVLATSLLSTFAGIYQQLSDAQLSAYLSFLAGKPGQHATAVGLRALEDAMIDAAGVFGHGLVGAAERSNT